MKKYVVLTLLMSVFIACNAADEVPVQPSTVRKPDQSNETSIKRKNLAEDISATETTQPVKKKIQPISSLSTAAAISEIPMPSFTQDVDTTNRRKSVVQLVKRTIELAKTRDLDAVFHEITHGNGLKHGELYVFCYDEHGNCLAHGEEESLMWLNMYNTRDTYGLAFVQMMIETARKGSGWVTYEWRNATKLSYIEGFRKNGSLFLIGCGYYPHSKADAAVNLVKGAVAHFNEVVKGGYPLGEAFSDFSYPLGAFLRGDLYLYALDFNGRIMVQGDRPQLIGQNAFDYKDANGKLVNQIIINKLKDGAPAVWVDYVSKNATKWAYAEKITDAEGKNYFMAAGFYPEANRDAVVNLVRRGAQYLAKQGVSRAAKEFSDKRSNDFVYGDLYLFIYDFKGNCIAHGGNPELVGTNQWNDRDPDGKYFVREFIQVASERSESGWVDYRVNNLFQSVYVEHVKIGLEDYVVGSGLFPFSKKDEAVLLVKSATVELRDSDSRPEVFRKFTDRKMSFIRGDLSVFVYDMNGLCFVHGDNYEYIWRNRIGLKDDEGKPYVKLFIDTAKRGADEVSYRLGGLVKKAYVELLEKDGAKYIVGTSFFK